MGTITDTDPARLFTNGLQEVFFDGFDGTDLDRSKWPITYGGSTYWNGAFRWDNSQLSVANGELTISLDKGAGGIWNVGGLSSTPSAWAPGFSFTYGHVEIRAKVSEEVVGAGPCFLLWPASNDHWPPEIDILEVPNGNGMFTNHWQGPGGVNDDQYKSYTFDLDYSQWHTYALDWTPDHLTLYVDGQALYTTTEHIPHEAMTVGLQGHVGAAFDTWYGGSPNGSGVSSIDISVDYVRISQWTDGYPAAPEQAAPAPAPAPVPTPVPTGDDAPPAKFGAPGAWDQDAAVWTGHLGYAGTDYLTFGAMPSWGTLEAVRMAPGSWKAGYATNMAFDNFVQTNLDLSAAGSTDLDILLVSARRGAVTLGEGDDHLTWVAHSEAGGGANQMAIRTGGGDNVVHLTAAGLSSLADTDKNDNGSLYDAAYDGHYSTAQVHLGAGHDSVVTEGMVKLVAYGGAGFAHIQGGGNNDLIQAGTGGGRFAGGAGRDVFAFESRGGHVVIEDFTSRTDKLKFLGLTAADVHTEQTAEGGVAGLLITYGDQGSSVFLEHVAKLAAADMIFA